MKSKIKPHETFRNQVVVITGASSGIGKATALEFARRGASLVVAARRGNALEDLVAECQTLGAQARAVPADVSNEAAVRNIAKEAIRRFGNIDIWINNAGVSAAGKLEQLPSEVFRRIIDVNLFGCVHGAKAALPVFREQGRGVLINVASQLGKMGGAYFSPYSISKFGVVSLGECLRQELEGTNIHVCTVLPATIDTPLFQHAGTYAGRPVKAMPPIYDVQEVADTIVELAENPQREVFVGTSARRMTAFHNAMPGVYERLAPRKIEKDHFENKPAADNPGNVFDPVPYGTDIRGGWRRRERARKMRNAAMVFGSLAVPALAWYFNRNRSRFSLGRGSAEDPGPGILHKDPEMEMPDPKQIDRDIRKWEKVYGSGKKDPAA
jgi:NAD(P)-dependent dehydrogenase (short-subunit alcohol dehydrogenase family)